MSARSGRAGRSNQQTGSGRGLFPISSAGRVCHGGHTLSRTLASLIDGLPIELVRGSPSTIIGDLVEDSRRAGPASLFIARAGLAADGEDHIPDAVRRGAVAVLTRSAGPNVEGPTTLLTTGDVAGVIGPLAERFHGDPAAALRLVGVTGTNGKTTVAHLVHQVLSRAGARCGLIGTVLLDDGRGPRPADMTTPPAIEISRHLAAMVRNACTAAVLEVSSHALHQQRTAGLAFDVGVFTNLSGDHLDYHGTLDEYTKAKAVLFRSLPRAGIAVVNADDPAARRMTEGCVARVLACSLADSRAACTAEIGAQTIRHTEVRLRGPWGLCAVRLPLAGRHNVANALHAAAACWALGVDGATLRTALEQCAAPPGRLEPVTMPHDDFSVLVDYAHTDDALDNVLRTLRPLVPAGGRLRVVFGCGGDRDRTKRPRMGRVAAGLADELFVTSDNPRTEDPRAIIDEILTGVPPSRRGDASAVVDRRAAIEAAVGTARPADVLLIAGKGHEPCQIIGTRRRPFDDRRVAAAALARRREAAPA